MCASATTTKLPQSQPPRTPGASASDPAPSRARNAENRFCTESPRTRDCAFDLTDGILQEPGAAYVLTALSRIRGDTSLRCVGEGAGEGVMNRQVDRESGASPDLAIHFDPAAMFAHDGVGNRQAEPDGVS